MHANFIFNFFFTFNLTSLILLNSFIQSKQYYSSYKYHKQLHLVSFKVFFFFSIGLCNKWLSFLIFLMNINGWWFILFTNSFLNKILDAEMITLWALNFWPSTLAWLEHEHEHDKGLSLDLSVIIVSQPLLLNCINYVLYPVLWLFL